LVEVASSRVSFASDSSSAWRAAAGRGVRLENSIPGVTLAEHANGDRELRFCRHVVQIQHLLEPRALGLQSLAFGDDGLELVDGRRMLDPLVTKSQELVRGLRRHIGQPEDAPPLFRIEAHIHPHRLGRSREPSDTLLEAFCLESENFGKTFKSVGPEVTDPQRADLGAEFVGLR
jgi:hypothetical protein